MSPAIYTLICVDFKLLYSFDIIKNPYAFDKTLTLCLIGPITIFVQDFRDMNGDLKIGRKTLPIKFGLILSRYICCLFCIMSILIIKFIHPEEHLYLTLNIVLLSIISLRIILKNKLKDDKLTYDIWCIWYCINYFFIY